MFLTRKEFPQYAKHRWGWKKQFAKKHWEEQLHLKGTKMDDIIEGGKKVKTIGFQKPKELDDIDAVTMGRSSSARAGQMTRCGGAFASLPACGGAPNAVVLPSKCKKLGLLCG